MKKLVYWLALGTIVLAACQKETSFELGTTPGSGSLQSDATGDCLPKTISGTYVAGTPLVPTVSTMTVSVNVTKTGVYLITTDTVNGYFFRATGTFTALGPTNVILRSSGTPFASGINNFVVSFDGTICDIQVTVLPSGTGPATFTLAGAPAACTTPAINGSYIQGIALNATNTVVLNVNVTSAGSYNVTTVAANGMTFAGTGTVGMGPQTITLTGTGTPATATSTSIPITVGASTCTFTIVVTTGAVYTINCPGVTVQGTYQVGVALTGANTITIPVTAVTTPGPYSISGTVNGMTFSGSGTITVPGNIVLTGSGTPTAAASPTSSLVLTSPACTIPITVAAGTGAAVYTINCPGVTVQGTYQVGTALTAANTITIPVTAVTTPGTYTITGFINGMTFSGTGNLTVPGNIILTGTGTPTAAASPTSNLVLTSPACTIPITVAAGGGPAVYAINCAGVTVQGTYQVGVALTAANTITIPVTSVTTPGTYTISGFINGMTFSGTGNISAPGNIILTGTGTPTAAATPTSSLVLTTPSCTIIITVQPPLSNDYYPRTTNSNWSYEWDDDGLDSLYRTVIAATHSAAGNTYNIFMANDGTGLDSSGYYRKNGGDYLEWFDLGTWIGLDAPSWGEYIMLKDNVPAGTNWKTGTWQGTITGTPVWIRFSYTLIQNDIPLSFSTTLGTMNYTNVKVVEEKIEGSTDGVNFIDLTADVDYFGRSYYARGIGLVQFEVYDAGGVKQAWQELRRRVVF